MSDPKRHHYVPQMLQNNFVGADGLLWAFDSRAEKQGLIHTRPGNLLVQGHLYSHVNSDGTHDVSLEKAYSLLEDSAAQVIRKAIDSVRRRTTPKLTPHERQTWDMFFYQHFRRVPDFQTTLLTGEDTILEIEKLLKEFHTTVRPLLQNEVSAFLRPATVKRTLQNVRVAHLSQQSDSILSTLKQRGVAFIRVADGRKAFILGSRPVVKLTPPGESHVLHPSVEMWLPVASDVMIGLGQIGGGEIYVEIDSWRVRHVNQSIAKQSSQIAARSELLIKSLQSHVGKLQRQGHAGSPTALHSNSATPAATTETGKL